ncbi:UDP-N-acetylmuramoyl-L-alanine--D-glutamate ligase [bacterium]|nr:UDP-N-acetylmuramoyl-L-alanine--D-glutamate ligase [candidate division CSSED10-310 bacterium]
MNSFNFLDFQHKSVHVVGISGAEGYAILSFLNRKGFTHLTGHDLHEGEWLKQSFDLSHVSLPKKIREIQFQQLQSLPVTFHLGPSYLTDITSAELIFTGQNWFAHPENAILADLRSQGKPFGFLIQLYFALSPAPIVAVTGTNGKTTLSTLLAHLLETAGKPYLVSGNDRYQPQVLDRLESLDPSGYFVLEVSNRQLMEINQGPHIGIITNIREDHLNEHGSFEEYIRTKYRLFRFQTDKDWAIINTDDPICRRFLETCPAKPLPYSVESLPANGAGPVATGYALHRNDARISLFQESDVHIPGKHNISNILAASCAAFLMGIPPETIEGAIRTFRGVKNRIEYIDTVNSIAFYDDLASTNPAATEAALSAFSHPIILICGGDLKGNRSAYENLARRFTKSVKHLFIITSPVSSLIKQLVGNHSDVFEVSSLEAAVIQAYSTASPHDTILLSPSGAGFYSQFIARQKGYRRLIRDLSRQIGK